MTSDASCTGALALSALLVLCVAAPARAADPSYPFEGTWVRANRVCVANAPLTRTYTARDVTFASGHCSFRKVVSASGQFEIFEDCRRADRPGRLTETIRMLSPDLMQMRRQETRLKIPRPLRFTRCTIAAPAPAGAPKPAPVAAPHRGPSAALPHGVEPHEGEPRDTDDHAPKAAAPKP